MAAFNLGAPPSGGYFVHRFAARSYEKASGIETGTQLVADNGRG
jgi:hypothetical protein